MRARQRFLTGMAGVCLGNGLLALSFGLDRSLGAATTVALVGAAVAAVGAAAVLFVARTNPDEFEFTGSKTKRYAPTAVLVGGLVTVFAGSINLALAAVG